MKACLPGDWGGLVVICASMWWDPIPYQDRHLAEQLSRIAPVLYVDPPLSGLTPRHFPELAPAVEGARLRLVRPSLARLTPVVLPGPQRVGMTRVTKGLVRRAVRRAVASLGGDVQAVVACSALVHSLGVCGERKKIYWAQDDFAGGAELFGLSADRIRRGEELLAAKADVVVASSPGVFDAWRARRDEVELIPFGCDDTLFATTDEAPLPHDVHIPSPVAGFIGQLADRIDIRLLEAVAARGRSLLLVGPPHAMFDLRRLAGLLDRPNVQWVGQKRFDELPSYQRVIDVGLVPYADSAFNRGSFPLKTLEYLAAGRAVVATDLPSTRWLDTELISVASEPDPFADLVDHLLDVARTTELIARRRAFAAEHSWSKRAAQWARLLGVAQADRVRPETMVSRERGPVGDECGGERP